MAKDVIDEMDARGDELIISLVVLPMSIQGLVTVMIELVCDAVKSSLNYISESVFGVNPWTGGPSWLMWMIQRH